MDTLSVQLPPYSGLINMFASSGHVFKPLAVTHGFFCTSLKIPALCLWNHSCLGASALNCLRLLNSLSNCELVEV